MRNAEILKRDILKGNSKACHLDPIPTWLVKECLDVLIPIITNIVNTSLDSSLMPNIFKTTTVTPLLKKSGLNVEEYKNFRPVSNLPYLSKVIEKVVVKQLNNYMEVNGLRKRKRDHVTPLLKHLHWLPVKKPIEYKILVLTYKSLIGEAPSYISEMFHPYVPTRPLRSAQQLLLKEKRTTLKSGGVRVFSAAAPKLWINLPLDIRECKNVNIFKKAVKTYLFKCTYD